MEGHGTLRAGPMGAWCGLSSHAGSGSSATGRLANFMAYGDAYGNAPIENSPARGAVAWNVARPLALETC